MSAPARTGNQREALFAASEALAAAGVGEPRLDAELMLAEACGSDRARLAADPSGGVEPAAARRFAAMVRRRLAREPLAYILGRRGFRQIELAVDARVLIPRPETELLVELALELAPRSVFDLGTGSGAIALAVAAELPECEVSASDSSPAALAVAWANAERLELSDRVRFARGSLPSAGSFDLLLANLPYVAEPDWPALQPEVTRWEPREALLAGSDGLGAYRELCAALAAGQGEGAPAFQVVGVEVGAGQAAAVAALFGEAGFGLIEVRRDLAGIERVVVARR